MSIFANIIRSNSYYVDKTKLVMKLLDTSTPASTILFTRPRRFGKSLALDMLHCFFDCTAKEKNRPLFDGLAVSPSEKHLAKQGKYPVIRVSFNGAKYDDWEQTTDCLASSLSWTFRQHRYLKDSQLLDAEDKQAYAKITSSETTLDNLRSSLLILSELLYRHHGQPVIILIDEYDVPIQSAYQNNYFQEMVSFMRAFFTKGLKDNTHLRIAVLTGYLKPVQFLRDERYLLAVPNREIQTIFTKEILHHIKHEWKIKDIDLLGDTQEFEEQLRRYLQASLSYLDNQEAFYHGWMMGILASLDSCYLCLSNREAGEGRSDIILTPRFGRKLPGLIMELKHGKNLKQLNDLAIQALQQIQDSTISRSFCPKSKRCAVTASPSAERAAP